MRGIASIAVPVIVVLYVQARYGKFTCELAARHFYEVCDALEYLHTQTPQIIHRRNYERA